MSLSVAVIVVLFVLNVLNLMLTSAIIRRLRDHRQARPAIPEIGTGIGHFSVTANDGTIVTDNAIADGALVAFLSPTCPPCRRMTGSLADRARDLTYPTVAFVLDDGGPERAREYADALGPAVRTAVVTSGSAAAAAFGVGDVTPTLIQVRHGTVTAVGHDLDAILLAHQSS